jgi:cystathionine gamma-lyase
MSVSDMANAAARLLHHREKGMESGASIVPPIAPASIYYLPGAPNVAHQYGRWTNPTWTALEDALAVLEDAECVTVPSGMAAIASVLLTQTKPGDRVIIPADGYYTTRTFADKYLTPAGVLVEPVPTGDLEATCFEGIRLVYVETPSNPGLDLCDLHVVIRKAKAAGAIVVVDNTTLTPFGQRPLDLGADVIVASDTKAPNGHSDVLMGHIASRNAGIVQAVRDWRKLVGAIPGHFEAWLLNRGMETLEVRFDRMCTSAAIIAERLSEHAAVKAVKYPGLATHPRHALARKQMLRFGSVLSLTVADAKAADTFIANAKFILPATSFGGVHTSAERRARWGDQVPEGFIRLSIGIEPTEILWKDIASSLAIL